jgi:branched-chain amino acid transport system permease protein
MDMDLSGAVFGSTIVSGLSIGLVYALIAFGLTLIFNATGFLNFAQGELVMIGGVTAALLAHISWPFGAAAAVVGAVAVGIILALLTLARIGEPDPVRRIVIAVAVSIVAAEVARVASGGQALVLPALAPGTFSVLGIFMSLDRFVMGFIAIAALAICAMLLRLTRLGKSVASGRAGTGGVATVIAGFALASFLGAIAGLGVAMNGEVNWNSGFELLLAGLAAALLGGFGSLRGSIVGGLILGIVQSLAAAFVNSAVSALVAPVLILLSLFIAPAGLFGEREKSRV